MQKHCTSDRQVSKSVSIQFVTCLKYSVTRKMNEYKDCAWQYIRTDSIVALMEVSNGQESSNSHCPTTIPHGTSASHKPGETSPILQDLGIAE